MSIHNILVWISLPAPSLLRWRKTRWCGNTECLKMEKTWRHVAFFSNFIQDWFILTFSITEEHENSSNWFSQKFCFWTWKKPYISVVVGLMLFLMDLRVLLTRHLMGNKEPGGRLSGLVMDVTELWQNIRKDSKYRQFIADKKNFLHELWTSVKYTWLSSVSILICCIWTYVRKLHDNVS